MAKRRKKVLTPEQRQRRALRRWLVFGPMILPTTSKDRLAAALKNRAQASRFGARVTRSGGPAAPGLFKHKTFSKEGSLLVRRGRMSMPLKRKDMSAAVKKSWRTRKSRYGRTGSQKRRASKR
jgi:hypothetical protein